ncbi:MAG: ABC transporter substrate-binding protein [Alphaproteobacteria bacterium]
MRIKSTVSRRSILKGAGVGAAAVAFPAVLTPRKTRAAVTITVRDPGGPFEQAFGAGLYKPFNEKYKGQVEVVGVAGKHEPTSQIKAMVDTKTYTWDAALLSLAAHNLLRDGGYLEELGLKGTAYDEIRPEYKTPTFQGNDVYAAVIAYRTDKVKKPPKSWADLWNVKDFPGRRSLRKYPFDTIEEALMADGVPTNKVYPCDFDRAFKSLDKIKKDIPIWWDQGAQTSQMLKTAEVDMMPTWNGRAQVVIDEGAPVALEWNQNIAGVEGWTILKGTPRADWCRKFIAFAAEGKNQAAWAELLSYGPTNPNAYKIIPAARAKVLATYPAYAENSLLIDNDFWGKEKDKAIDMFNAWMLKG